MTGAEFAEANLDKCLDAIGHGLWLSRYGKEYDRKT